MAFTGIDSETVREVARDYAKTRPAGIFTGNGLEHHPFGVNTTRLLAVLKAITGNLDEPGGDLFTPKPNIRDITAPLPSPTISPVGARRFPVFCRARGEGHALCIPAAILDEKPYPIKGMTITGGNPTLQWPDSNRTAEALKKLEFLLVVDVVASPDSHYADVVLPACTFLERDEHRINVYLNLPHVTLRQAVTDPLYGLPDQMIWMKLAHAMGYGSYFPWKNCKEGIDELLADVGVSYESLVAEGGIHEYAQRTYRQYEKTDSTRLRGKWKFSQGASKNGVRSVPDSAEDETEPDGCGRIRSVDVDHRRQPGFLYPLAVPVHSGLRKWAPEPFLEIHPDTAAALGVSDSDRVEVTTETGTIRISARICETIRPGTLHLAQGWEGSNANQLTSVEYSDPISGFPNLKSLRCRIRNIPKMKPPELCLKRYDESETNDRKQVYAYCKPSSVTRTDYPLKVDILKSI